MKTFLVILLSIAFSTSYSQEKNEYGYPMDEQTGKITYDKSVTVNGTKEKLFKRAQQFVAIQNFDEIAEIKTKGKGSFRGKLVEKAITYSDLDEGKIFGNGYMPFTYRNREYFVITFSYKIYLKDNSYRYKFTNFEVHEFIHAGKSRETGGYGMSGGKNLMSDAEVRHYPLEDFIYKSAYDRSDDDFTNAISKLKHDLKQAMIGEL